MGGWISFVSRYRTYKYPPLPQPPPLEGDFAALGLRVATFTSHKREELEATVILVLAETAAAAAAAAAAACMC
jgi:hypothetical protein